MLDIAHVFLFTYCVSRITPPCRQSLVIISTVLSGCYRLEKNLNVWYSEVNCSISSKLMTFITNTLRFVHTHFQSH